MKNTDPRVVGGLYFCGYWQQEYTVTAICDRDGTRWFTVKWSDGHQTTHCTAWDPRRDRVIRLPEDILSNTPEEDGVNLYVAIGDKRLYFPIRLTEEQAQQFAELLENNEHAEKVTIALEDEAGAKLGVVGKVYDSEA